MSGNDDYTTGNLSIFSYHQNYFKLSVIDLSKQENKSIPQKINFVGKLKNNNGVIMHFTAEKQQRNNFNVFFRFIKSERII